MVVREVSRVKNRVEKMLKTPGKLTNSHELVAIKDLCAKASQHACRAVSKGQMIRPS